MEKGKTYRHKDGGYYEVAEVTHSEVSFFPCGGGFVSKAAIDTFNQDFVESELPTDMICGPVTLDGLPEPVKGWYCDEQRWNGWMIPYISLDDCLKVLEIDQSHIQKQEDGYLAQLPDSDEAFLVRCRIKGLEDFYYIDGFCWETADVTEGDNGA